MRSRTLEWTPWRATSASCGKDLKLNKTVTGSNCPLGSDTLALATIDIDDGSMNPSRFFCCEKGDELAWFAETRDLQTPGRINQHVDMARWGAEGARSELSELNDYRVKIPSWPAEMQAYDTASSLGSLHQSNQIRGPRRPARIPRLSTAAGSRPHAG